MISPDDIILSFLWLSCSRPSVSYSCLFLWLLCSSVSYTCFGGFYPVVYRTAVFFFLSFFGRGRGQGEGSGEGGGAELSSNSVLYFVVVAIFIQLHDVHF